MQLSPVSLKVQFISFGLSAQRKTRGARSCGSASTTQVEEALLKLVRFSYMLFSYELGIVSAVALVVLVLGVWLLVRLILAVL